MQYSQEHLKTMVYAKFGGQTECIMGNWKIENNTAGLPWDCWNFDQKYRRRKGVNEAVYILRGVRTNTKELNHLKF